MQKMLRLICLKFSTESYKLFKKKIKKDKCNYDVIADIMNINEAAQTY